MSIYIRELARELGRKGHRVDIYTRAHNPKDSEIMDLCQGVKLIHIQAGEIKDIHKLMVCSYLDDFTANLEAYRESNGISYDVVHSHYWLSGCVGRRLSAQWNAPHLIMFHTLGALKNAAGSITTEPEIRLERERDMVDDCDRIIAATEQERMDLIYYYGAAEEKVSVVPCGVNLDLFQTMDRIEARDYLNIHDNCRIVLFIGRIEKLKGIDNLIKAMPYLQDRETRLLIVGGDEQSRYEMEALQRLVTQMNIDDIVSFSGLVDQEELPYYYNAADVCVIPSYYESFGLVALESLACGTPIVANKVGIVDTLLQNHEVGVLVDDHSAENLAEGINRVLSSKLKRSAIAEVAHRTVENFSWERVACRMIEQYKQTLPAKQIVSC